MQEAEVVGYSWSQGEGHGVYVPEKPHKMAVILEDPRQEVVCHNAKFEVTHLKNNGITLTNFHDTKLCFRWRCRDHYKFDTWFYGEGSFGSETFNSVLLVFDL